MRWSPVHDPILSLRAAALAAATCLVAVGGVCAQHAGSELGPPISLSNASFEDAPRQGHPPRGWYDCSFSSESPVDVHPASLFKADSAYFGVNHRAFDGNTYLGMVVRDNETYEAVSQRLQGGPLRAGKCYTFSIYLARESGYYSLSRTSDSRQPVNYATPAKLRIFGGMGYCNRGEVIAESAPVKNEEWLQDNFRLEPKRDHSFIVIEAYYKTPVLFAYNGNILVDAAGKIVPVACDEDAEPEPEPPLAEQPARAAEQPVAAVAAATPERPAPTRTPTPAASKPAPRKPDAKLQGISRAELRAGQVVRVEKLFFKADSSAVSPASEPVLEELYDFLEANEDIVIEVGGHTNGQPPHAYCDWLSQERAEAVVEYLVRRGIGRQRLFAKGYGKRKPVATNKTPTGRRRNQRVEIKVLSIG